MQNKNHRARPTGLAALKIAAALGVGIIGLFAAAPDASALESFNVTNQLAGGTAVIGMPTNSVLTVTNSSSTNQVGAATGKQIEVRNYTFVGFRCTFLSTSTNTGNLNFQVIRAITDNPPVVQVNTNTGSLTNTDWETTPTLVLSVPIPIGTNVFINWQTNLDESFTKPAAYEGIYSISNTIGPAGSVSNLMAGLGKKVIPVSLTGGNF